MPAASEALRHFMESLNRGVTSREDLERLDLEALEAVSDLAEKTQATDALVARLKAPTEDPRLVDALATLRTPVALDALTWASRSATPLTRARAARRLWALRHDPNALANLQAVARVDAESVAEEVLPALREIGTDEAMDVALGMLASSSLFGVRSAALNTLFVFYLFDEYDRIPTGPMWALHLDLQSRLPSLRARALDTLRDLVHRRRAGADDAALGIVAQISPFSAPMTAVLAASQDPSRAFDDAALTSLSGGERRFGVDLVIAALERGEARAEKALETLGGDRAQLALDDWRAGRIDPE